MEIKISLKMIEIQQSSKTKITVSSKRFYRTAKQHTTDLKFENAEICKEMNDYYTYKHNLSSCEIKASQKNSGLKRMNTGNNV